MESITLVDWNGEPFVIKIEAPLYFVSSSITGGKRLLHRMLLTPLQVRRQLLVDGNKYTKLEKSGDIVLYYVNLKERRRYVPFVYNE